MLKKSIKGKDELPTPTSQVLSKQSTELSLEASDERPVNISSNVELAVISDFFIRELMEYFKKLSSSVGFKSIIRTVDCPSKISPLMPMRI